MTSFPPKMTNFCIFFQRKPWNNSHWVFLSPHREKLPKKQYCYILIALSASASFEQAMQTPDCWKTKENSQNVRHYVCGPCDKE
jgi:hypothetical protein